MKKELFLLAAFIALNVAAQPSIDTSNDFSSLSYAYAKSRDVATASASISLQIDTKKDILKIRSTLPVNELSINNLYGKKLISKRNSSKVKLSSLPRGVYELEVRLEGTTFHKRIILE